MILQEKIKELEEQNKKLEFALDKACEIIVKINELDCWHCPFNREDRKYCIKKGRYNCEVNDWKEYLLKESETQ